MWEKRSVAQYVFPFQTETPSCLFSRIFQRISFFFKGKREMYLFSGIGRRVLSPFVAHGIFQGTAADIPLSPPSCKVKGEERKRKKKNLWHPFFFFFFFFRTSKKRKKPSSSSSQKDKQMLERGRSEVQDSPIFFASMFFAIMFEDRCRQLYKVFLSTFLFSFFSTCWQIPRLNASKSGS